MISHHKSLASDKRCVIYPIIRIICPAEYRTIWTIYAECGDVRLYSGHDGSRLSDHSDLFSREKVTKLQASAIVWRRSAVTEAS